MFPQNVFPDSSEIDAQGELVLGGCKVSDLADEYGTPVYVLDEDTLRGRCRSFIDEFRKLYPATNVSYACKAYINPALAKLFQEEGMGFDVVSGGELATTINAQIPMNEVYFHGNNKTPQELSEALDHSIGWVVVDSFHEMQLLDQLAGEVGKKQDILIRVSPGVDPHTHVYTTTGILDSKFGFSIQTGHAAEAVRMGLAATNLNLRGLHFHLGSPIFEIEPYRVAVDVVLRFAAEFREEGLEMTKFSPGGGFAIGYTTKDEPPPVSAYAEAIISTMTETCRDLGMDMPSLVIEPGRAIIGPAGVALYRIGAIKEIPGVRKFVSVDGGMGDNIRPALYQAEYEVVAATKVNHDRVEKVTIAGKYCESGDLLASDIMLPKLVPGDLLAVPAAGAYCPSMASNYNMNPRPPMVIVKSGKSRLIRRRESYQDLMHCDVI
ncbi:MAG: diaminopimelate decarboxylase [Dehalococcoidia bacterium]|nr:diaminopimelate decarboxylase [Dehalococcoidia bacterium]